MTCKTNQPTNQQPTFWNGIGTIETHFKHIQVITFLSERSQQCGVLLTTEGLRQHNTANNTLCSNVLCIQCQQWSIRWI